MGFYFVFFNIVKILIGFTYAPLAPDRYGCTPIHYAAANGSLKTVETLVGLTKTPNSPDTHGRTPLHLAKYCENEEVQRFLENYCK